MHVQVVQLLLSTQNVMSKWLKEDVLKTEDQEAERSLIGH